MGSRGSKSVSPSKTNADTSRTQFASTRRDQCSLKDKCRVKSKLLLDRELELVKTAQWLVQNGANLNAKTTEQEPPLQLALQAKHLILAKLASGLSESHFLLVRSVKADVATIAITSISSSASTSVHRLHMPTGAEGGNVLAAAGNVLRKLPT
ncbi:hypothetical protein PsorP6_012087 [Peronosclerospora sorghi]|uniref:Uncharacterized protein n=1 Tax=Peronosclerospora sorghi TaxID=230839 RepID=A0ACC0WHE2_9STRA|nr:hypothetical protein PsorP6_012087 [Peronosclerospora sorghi]